MSERYFPVPIAGKKVRNCSDVTPPFFFSCPTSSRPTLVTDSLTHCVGFKAFRPSRPNRNLAKLMGVMRKHDLTNNTTTTNTKTQTNTITMTNTFREHLQRAIFETLDLWDIWSESWEKTTWSTKNNDKDNDNDKYKEQSLWLKRSLVKKQVG